MNHDNKSIEKSFLLTLHSENLENILKDSSELVIDSMLSDGIARDIPIVNFVYSLAKTGISIRERFFIEKIIKFLAPLGKYTEKERTKFLDKLNQDELKEASKCMMLYLDRLDSLDKPEMLGRVFEAYMKGAISHKSMLYFSHFIDSVFILVWQDYYSAIKHFHDKRSGTPRIAIDDALALEKIGFYQQELRSEKGIIPDSYTEYLKSTKRKLALTNAGWDFIRTVFQLWTDEPDSFFRGWLGVSLDNI